MISSDRHLFKIRLSLHKARLQPSAGFPSGSKATLTPEAGLAALSAFFTKEWGELASESALAK